MSELLDTLCGADRLAECAKTDEPALREFRVVFGDPSDPRLSIPVMAPDACTALAQNLCLREGNEKVQAWPECSEAELLAADRENAANKAQRRADADYLAAMELQRQEMVRGGVL